MGFVKGTNYWVSVYEERDRNNNIVRYELALPFSFSNAHGLNEYRKVYNKVDLKKAILKGEIKVDNLQITSDGRLVPAAIQNTRMYNDGMQNMKEFFATLKTYAEGLGLKIKGQIVKRTDTEIKESGLVVMMDIMLKDPNSNVVKEYSISVDNINSWYLCYYDKSTGQWEYDIESACCQEALKYTQRKIHYDFH